MKKTNKLLVSLLVIGFLSNLSLMAYNHDYDFTELSWQDELEGVEDDLRSRITDVNDTLNQKIDDLDKNLSDDIADINQTLNARIDDIEDDIADLNSSKVDKVDGKGLSTNDLTDDLKTLIENLKVYSIEGNVSEGTLDITYSDGSKDAIKVSDLVDDDYVEDGNFSLTEKSLTLDMKYGDQVVIDFSSIVDRVNDHIADKDNPHEVTKAQVGLDEVDNTSDADKPLSNDAISALNDLNNSKVDKVAGKQLSENDLTDDLKELLERKKIEDANVTVDGTSIEVLFTDGTSKILDLKLDEINTDDFIVDGTTSIRDKRIELTLQSGEVVFVNLEAMIDYVDNHVRDKDNPHEVTKAQVGLSDVDNTSDASKPISTATQNALDSKVDKVAGKQLSEEDFTTELKALVELKKVQDLVVDSNNDLRVEYIDGSTKIIEIDDYAVEGVSDVNNKKITIKMKSGGTFDIDISNMIDLINSHIADKDNPHEVTKDQVGLGNVDNTSDLDKPISTVTQNALDGKVDKVAGKELSENDFTDALKQALEAKKVKDVSLDEANSNLVISYTDGTSKNISILSLIEDDYVENGSLSKADKKIILDMALSANVDIDMTSLYDDLDLKVDKVAGKQLSENDLTDALLQAIEDKKVYNVEGDDANNRLKITFSDTSVQYIDMMSLIDDNFVESGLLSVVDKRITLVRSEGVDVIIDMSELVDKFNNHVADKDNPHEVTKAQVGLSDVDNTSDADKPISDDVQYALDGKVDKVVGKELSTNDFTDALKDLLEMKKVKEIVGDDANDRLVVTYTDGITANIDLNAILDDDYVDSGSFSLTDKKITLTRVEGVDVIIDMTSLVNLINNHLSDTDNPHDVSKDQVGLGNVNNTSDLDKPISTVTQNALDGKVDKVAGKELSTNDFTDALKDLLEMKKVREIVGDNANNELDVTYTDGTTASISLQSLIADRYLESGVFSLTNSSLTLDVRDGDQVVIDFSSIVDLINNHIADKDNPHEVTKAQVGLGNVDNTSDLNKPISIATQTALDDKVDKVAGKELSTNDFTDALKADVEADRVIDVIADSDPATKIAIDFRDGADKVINLGIEKYSNSGTLNTTSKAIDINVVDGTNYSVNMTPLFHDNRSVLDDLLMGNDDSDDANEQLEHDGVRVDMEGTINGGEYTFTTVDGAFDFINKLGGKKIVDTDLIVNLPAGNLIASIKCNISGIGSEDKKLIIKGSGESNTKILYSGSSTELFLIKNSWINISDLTIDMDGDDRTKAIYVEKSHLEFGSDSVTIRDSKLNGVVTIADNSDFYGNGMNLELIRCIIIENSSHANITESTITQVSDSDSIWSVIVQNSSTVDFSDSTVDSNDRGAGGIFVGSNSYGVVNNFEVVNFKSDGIRANRNSTIVGTTITLDSSVKTGETSVAKINLSSVAELVDVKATDLKFGVIVEDNSVIKLYNSTLQGLDDTYARVEKNSYFNGSGNTVATDSGANSMFQIRKLSSVTSIDSSFNGGGKLGYLRFNSLLEVINCTASGAVDVELLVGSILNAEGTSGVTSNVNSNDLTFDGRRVN